MGDKEILDCPMGPNDADAGTVRQYFALLALQVWEEDEGFSGKRPFGNSGWWGEPIKAVKAFGLIGSGIDDDDARDLIGSAIRSMGGEEFAPPAILATESTMDRRAEAMARAEQFVKSVATNDRGFTNIDPTARIREVLRVARFFLGEDEG